MGIIMLISLAGFFLAGFPFITYLYAKQKGLNAKKWLIIGILLPGIATLILSFFPNKERC